MEIKIGSKVRFLNDVGGGLVIKIENKNTVIIRIEDGFDIPVSKSECVVVGHIDDDLKKSNNSKNVPEKQKEIISAKFEEPVIEDDIIEGNENPKAYFAFVPLNQNNIINSDCLTYIINDCNYKIVYNIMMVKNQIAKSLAVGEVQANTKLLIHQFYKKDFSESITFIFQIMYYSKNDFKVESPSEKVFYMIPEKFFAEINFKENDFFDENALLVPLHKDIKSKDAEKKMIVKSLDEILKQKKEGESIEDKSKRFTARPTPETIEVDLHINKLLDNVKGMSNGEILMHQMKVFHQSMTDAIEKKVAKIVFIHGIGNGTLKTELRKTMETQYSKYPYQDASFKEYGFGATMVLLIK